VLHCRCGTEHSAALCQPLDCLGCPVQALLHPPAPHELPAGCQWLQQVVLVLTAPALLGTALVVLALPRAPWPQRMQPQEYSRRQ